MAFERGNVRSVTGFVKSSRDTVLRRVKARRRGAIQPAVRVLSVDDWAWRKKQRYGTMLMDLERSQVIDLLPDRSDLST
jgi:transposase